MTPLEIILTVIAAVLLLALVVVVASREEPTPQLMLPQRPTPPPQPPKPLASGEVAQLKSGGPRMVLDIFDSCSGWWCIWFDPAGVRQQAYFKPELLKRV